LSFPQTVRLMQTVLARRTLSPAESLALIRKQLQRNAAATRSHLRRHRAIRGRQSAPT
jgi:hypothetical protein